MNKNLKIKQFGRSSSQQQKIKKTVFVPQRSKTPDKMYENILLHNNIKNNINSVRSDSIFVPFKVLPDSDDNSVIFLADYNFLNKYLELSKGAYPKSFNQQVDFD